jgi:hypothetical protein
MNQSIHIQVGGVQVRGEITHRSEIAIDVKIVEPYQGISTGRNYPLLGAKPPVNYLDKYGDDAAREMLEQLYFTCLTIHKNKADFKKELEKYDTSRSDVVSKTEPFREKKRILKAEFKRSRIGQKEYQSDIKILNKQISALTPGMYDLFKEHFSRHFDGIEYAGRVDKVLAYIRDS